MRFWGIGLIIIIIAGLGWWNGNNGKIETGVNLTPEKVLVEQLPEQAILKMREREYPASDILIDETLPDGANYKRFIAHYKSDGLKIYGLFTVPKTEKPIGGFPAVVFVHGHLEPTIYKTTERYVAYQDRIARAGFVTFKPDLRGHGKSEGKSVNSNFSPGYVIDALNLVSALGKYPEVDPDKIGMWGHSMGGGITLRAMTVNPKIKAGVIWAGVVGDWQDLIERYRKRIPWMNGPSGSSASAFLEKYGSPSAEVTFWNTTDAYNYLKDLGGPIQLHHGTADDSVPVEFSRHLHEAMEMAGKTSELYEYPGGDHNISGANFTRAMDRTVEFFKRIL
jgi:dipeptidyl aminopeptidase/acylaminoacyl peptidase